MSVRPVKSEAVAPQATVLRPGVTTTEFWVTVIGEFYLVANNAGWWAQIPKQWSTVAMAILAAAYAVSRGWAKSQGTPHGSGMFGLQKPK